MTDSDAIPCLAAHPDGHACRLPKWHPGVHATRGAHGSVVWADPTDPHPNLLRDGEEADYPAPQLGQLVNDLLTERDRLRHAITNAITELQAAHQPNEHGKPGKPDGCQFCWPAESGWPCVTRMVADDLNDTLKQGV